MTDDGYILTVETLKTFVAGIVIGRELLLAVSRVQRENLDYHGLADGKTQSRFPTLST